jgi:integrase
LNDDTVTLWLNDMVTRGERDETKRSVSTSISYVTRVMTLWRWLFHKRMVETYPLFDMPDAPEPSPIALDGEQLRRLFESAMCRPGFVAGVPARYWWPALFGTAFCTSERKGALFAMRWEWVSLESKIAVIPAEARKGRRKTATYPLWDEVCWLLAAHRAAAA